MDPDLNTLPFTPSPAQAIVQTGAYALGLETEIKELRKQVDDLLNPPKRLSMRVTVWGLLTLLRANNVTQANTDRTKLARIISLLSGYSEKHIYECISDDKDFTDDHMEDIDQLKKCLSDLHIPLPLKS